jgi:hypothetical protein
MPIGRAYPAGLLRLEGPPVGIAAGELLVEPVELFSDVGMVGQPGGPGDAGPVGTVPQILDFAGELVGDGLPVASPLLLRLVERGSEVGDGPGGPPALPKAGVMVDGLSLRPPQVGLGDAHRPGRHARRGCPPTGPCRYAGRPGRPRR